MAGGLWQGAKDVDSFKLRFLARETAWLDMLVLVVPYSLADRARY